MQLAVFRRAIQCTQHIQRGCLAPQHSRHHKKRTCTHEQSLPTLPKGLPSPSPGNKSFICLFWTLPRNGPNGYVFHAWLLSLNAMSSHSCASGSELYSFSRLSNTKCSIQRTRGKYSWNGAQGFRSKNNIFDKAV